MPLKTEKFASVMQGHRFSNLTPRPPSAKKSRYQSKPYTCSFKALSSLITASSLCQLRYSLNDWASRPVFSELKRVK